jgi:hypothetical protein
MWNKQKDKRKDIDMLISELNNCARCGENHESICFYKLENPSDEWTHWAMCPTFAEPIMMLVEDEEDPLDKVKELMDNGEGRVIVTEN